MRIAFFRLIEYELTFPVKRFQQRLDAGEFIRLASRVAGYQDDLSRDLRLRLELTKYDVLEEICLHIVVASSFTDNVHDLVVPGNHVGGTGLLDKSTDQIGRASCRERVCQYV